MKACQILALQRWSLGRYWTFIGHGHFGYFSLFASVVSMVFEGWKDLKYARHVLQSFANESCRLLKRIAEGQQIEAKNWIFEAKTDLCSDVHSGRSATDIKTKFGVKHS